MTIAQYLVIAGTQKAGTTSMFNYLKAHPQVSPCGEKEPCYFLPTDYPVPSHVRQGRDPLEAYLACYPPEQPGKVRMEATATYLQIPGSAAQIDRSLPGTRVVISLREPIGRLVSWYKMCAMFALIPEGTAFDQFARLLLDDRSPMATRPHHLRGLLHGLYAPYVAEYLAAFGRERVHLMQFEDLKRDPRTAMRGVCRFAGIDPAYFDEYEFKVHFQSRRVRARGLLNAYEGLKRWVRSSESQLLGIRPLLGKLRARYERGYYELVTAPPAAVAPSAATLAALRAYYLQDAIALEPLLGAPAPWLKMLEGREEWAGTGGEE